MLSDDMSPRKLTSCLECLLFWLAPKEAFIVLYYGHSDSVDDFRGNSCYNDDSKVRGGNLVGIRIDSTALIFECRRKFPSSSLAIRPMSILISHPNVSSVVSTSFFLFQWISTQTFSKIQHMRFLIGFEIYCNNHLL